MGLAENGQLATHMFYFLLIFWNRENDEKQWQTIKSTGTPFSNNFYRFKLTRFSCFSGGLKSDDDWTVKTMRICVSINKHCYTLGRKVGDMMIIEGYTINLI